MKRHCRDAFCRSLDRNLFTGSIPETFGQLSMLTFLCIPAINTYLMCMCMCAVNLTFRFPDAWLTLGTRNVSGIIPEALGKRDGHNGLKLPPLR